MTTKPKVVTLYLARDRDAYEGAIYKRPPAATRLPPVPGVKAGPCSCGVSGCTTGGTPAKKAGLRFDDEAGNYSLTGFCIDGLRKAGIRLPKSTIWKLTITAEPITPTVKED